MPFNAIATAGYIIQNLRTALDHLAFQLVLAAGNRPTKDTCFPIAKSLDVYEKDKIRKTSGMRPEAIQAIDTLKPYAGGNHFLWGLHSLNNIDKHRVLLTVGPDIEFQAEWIPTSFQTFLIKSSTPDFDGVFDEGVESQMGQALLPFLRNLIEKVEELVFSFAPLLE